MIRTEKFDEFFNQQPPRGFIEDLQKPVHNSAPADFGKRAKRAGEADVSGMYIAQHFSEGAELLETAYADFELFLKVFGIGGNRFPLYLQKGETRKFEAYKVSVTADSVTVTANDTEGIRRALVFLEDNMRRAEGAFLQIGETERWPHMHTRITRGFFSPTNRPPKFGDELSDDIDYYPDEYLNRLAHDGTNGLWIYTSFRAILPPGMIPELGEGYEKRLEKLRRVIKNCARYGVKVYVFAMEPMAFTEWEMLNKYPQVWGATTWNKKKCFCTYTDFGKEYCIDAAKTMCELLPDLGGYISITHGERPTNCSNGDRDCPHCGHIPIGEVLSQAVGCIREGMRQGGGDNPPMFVSWTYGHRDWKYDDIRDYVRTAPDDVMLMQNLDDMGRADQLGKERIGADYWLSYAGPSELYEVTAAAAKEYGKHLFAKMQVCCSHEVASVPYLPVPGLIFEKFKGAHRLGTEGVMECWYFGNYPSLMSKAAGELSFLHDFSDKRAFLQDLAAITWGESRAAAIAQSWESFENGYVQYPLNIMFSYYGPMHDSIVWELYLEPKNFSLPRSWFSTDKTDGDRISECLLQAHTAEEAGILTTEMSRMWKEGLQQLLAVPTADYEERTEQLSVAKALDILFESGKNILEFYRLRDELGQNHGDNTALIDRMEALVHAEIERSRAMIPLCEADGRLGYHSEAENYKYFPAKIKHRIETLETLLKTEFPRVRARVAAGEAPLAYYLGEEEGIPKYKMHRGAIGDAAWEQMADPASKFRVAYDAENLYIEVESTDKKSFKFSPEYQLLHVGPSMLVDADGTARNARNNHMYYAMMLGDRDIAEQKKWQVKATPCAGTHFVITLKRTEIGWTEELPMKLRIGEDNDERNGSYWVMEEEPIHTLGKNDVAPGEFGWLLP